MYREASRDAVLIVCIAAVLGFSYTFLTGKGFFRTAKPSDIVKTVGSVPSSINLAEAKMLYDSGNAVFVDARHFFDYRRSHIKSAVNIPLNEFDSNVTLIDALPKDKVIVVYCDGSECNSSIELAAKFYERGIAGVRMFFGGWQEWSAQKLPLEASQ